MRWTAIIGGTRGIGFAATLVQEGWSVTATGVEREEVQTFWYLYAWD